MRRFAFFLVVGLSLAYAAPAFSQKSTDTLRIALKQPIRAISYYLDPKQDTVFETEAVFDNLVIFNEKDFKFEPLLAKSWKQTDDKILEFQLRDDIKWHDGEKFDADDVLYTLNWLVDPKTSGVRFKSDYDFIEKVEKTGTHTVRVVAKGPTPYALMRFAYLTSIEAEHAHGKAEDKVVYSSAKPVGTGMYRVLNIDRNKGIILERNEGFSHGGSTKPASNIEKIQLLFMPDSGTQVAQFLAGGIDLVIGPTLSVAEDMAKTPGSVLSVGQGISYVYMAIDAKGRSGVKPLTDVRVRRALMMAINRNDILQYVGGGRSLREPEAMCWKFQAGCDYTLKPYRFDPAGAKKLLAEAGYPDGFELELTTSTNQPQRGAATIIANQLNQVGVRASVLPTETGAYRKKQSDGKIQVNINFWSAGSAPDVASTISFIYAVPDSRDYTGDREMQHLAQKSLTISDADERKKIGGQIFDMSTDRAYFTPVAPIPTLFIHSDAVFIRTGSFTSFGFNPQDIRWKN